MRETNSRTHKATFKNRSEAAGHSQSIIKLALAATGCKRGGGGERGTAGVNAVVFDEWKVMEY